jgi:hypothetical protein
MPHTSTLFGTPKGGHNGNARTQVQPRGRERGRDGGSGDELQKTRPTSSAPRDRSGVALGQNWKIRPTISRRHFAAWSRTARKRFSSCRVLCSLETVSKSLRWHPISAACDLHSQALRRGGRPHVVRCGFQFDDAPRGIPLSRRFCAGRSPLICRSNRSTVSSSSSISRLPRPWA